MSEVNPILPIISHMKLEMQSMAQSMSKMSKTNYQLLEEEWLTKQQVLAILQVSPRTLENLKSSKKLPYGKLGRIVRFKASDVEKLLNNSYNR